MPVGRVNRGLKGSSLWERRPRSESQKVLASTLLPFMAMGKPVHSLHVGSLVCKGRSPD